MTNSVFGTVLTAIITDENEQFFFAQQAGVTYAMNKSEAEQLTVGDVVRGFVYESQQKRLRLTTVLPKSQVGQYGWATVTAVRKDLGVFVSIGLPDKDVVVSLDDLPQHTHLWPKKDDRLLVALKTDKKNRLWGQLADETVFRSLAKKADDTLKNADVTATVFRLKLVGTYVLTQDHYLGFIHPSERIDEPRLGEVVSARVIGVRPDGVLNLSLKPRAHEVIGDDAGLLLAMLQQADGHRLPFTDKSAPEAIKAHFGISKAQFKRAVGHLLKKRLIVQKEDGIYALKPLGRDGNG